MIRGFEHVNVTCSDMDRTLHFYCDLLGYRLVVRRPTSDGGEVAFVECQGGSQLEIVRPTGDIRPVDAAVPSAAAGIRHFALIVDDVDAAYETLSAAGVEFVVAPRDAVNSDILRRVCHCKDPDGIVVELVERATGRAI